MSAKYNLIREEKLNFEMFKHLRTRPELFEYDREAFWENPHIARENLKSQLDPNLDAGTRRSDFLDRTVIFLYEYLKLPAEANILDLGCGPGLTCQRLARYGYNVTGIDISKPALEFAQSQAKIEDLEINYVFQNYFTIRYQEEFDVALLTYGDLCSHSPEKRDLLLTRIYKALKPDGQFILDVSTRFHQKRWEHPFCWSLHDNGGYWSEEPHVLFRINFDYPEEHAFLEQYAVIFESGEMDIYRQWTQDYSLESIKEVLEEHGFYIEKHWSDITGRQYEPGSQWIAMGCRKITE